MPTPSAGHGFSARAAERLDIQIPINCDDIDLLAEGDVEARAAHGMPEPFRNLGHGCLDPLEVVADVARHVHTNAAPPVCRIAVRVWGTHDRRRRTDLQAFIHQELTFHREGAIGTREASVTAKPLDEGSDALLKRRAVRSDCSWQCDPDCAIQMPWLNLPCFAHDRPPVMLPLCQATTNGGV